MTSPREYFTRERLRTLDFGFDGPYNILCTVGSYHRLGAYAESDFDRLEYRLFDESVP